MRETEATTCQRDRPLSDAGAETSDLASLAEPVRSRFLHRHDSREAAFRASRDAIRAAANAIRAIHRGEFDRAHGLIRESREELDRAFAAAGGEAEVLYGGFLQDAAKEYAEAYLTAAAVAGESWPTPAEVGVDDGSWLHGLAETVGELRRHCLDRIRHEDLETAEGALERMDEIRPRWSQSTSPTR